MHLHECSLDLRGSGSLKLSDIFLHLLNVPRFSNYLGLALLVFPILKQILPPQPQNPDRNDKNSQRNGDSPALIRCRTIS